MRPASSRPASTTRSEPSSPTSTGTAGSTSTSRTTRIRTGSTRTWPGPVAREPIRPGSASASRSAPRSAGAADPNAGMGVADADADGDGLDRPLRQQLARPAARGPERPAAGKERRRRSPTGGPDSPPRSAARSPAGARRGPISTSTATPTSSSPTARSPSRTWPGTPQPIQVLENRAAAGSAAAVRRTPATTGLPRVVGRGLAVADYDNDGRLDVAINSVGGRLILLRSTAAGGNWLEVALAGFHPGARVTAVLPDGRRLVREVQAGSSYLSSEDPRVHFGLGAGDDGERADRALPERPRDAPRRGLGQPRWSPCARSPGGSTGCAARPPRPLGRAGLGRGRPRRDPARRARADHARPEPLPPLGRDVGRVGGLRPQRRRVFRRARSTASGDVQAARETAISYAAYRILLWRYAQGAGLQTTFDALTATMTSLCLEPGLHERTRATLPPRSGTGSPRP